MPQKKRDAANYPKRGMVPQKAPELPYDPRSLSREEALFKRAMAEEAAKTGAFAIQDAYGYVSPNRARMQELLTANEYRAFPSGTNVPSEHFTEGFFGERKNPERDRRQDLLYQAQLIMDALEQDRATKAGRRKP